MSTLLTLENVTKQYKMGEETVFALKNVSLSIQKGEFVAIIGPSGSGKSTLMNVIGCLDRMSAGTYFLNGQNVSEASDDQLARVRNHEIGFIFQSFNLLKRLTAQENIELSLMYKGMSVKERKSVALHMLERVGLDGKAGYLPNQLSGGQQQRVAIARAISHQPPILLADEPTGALDSKTGIAVMDMIKELHREGHTIVMITHDESIAAQADRIISIRDGEIIEGGDRDDTVAEH